MGPAEAGGVTGGVQASTSNLHTRCGVTLCALTCLPPLTMSQLRGHHSAGLFPNAEPPAGRRGAGSRSPGGRGAGGAQWPAEPSHGGRSDTAAESRGLSAARRREHNGPVVLCFLPSPPVIGRPRLLARHHCGNRGLMALPGWPSLSLFCASLWWRQYGTPSFSPSGQSV